LKYTTYLGLGSNVGNRRAYLAQARKLIAERVGEIARASSVYMTEAWGVEDQPGFLNQVVQVQTERSPERVLEIVLQIERDLGRERTLKWGKRKIDIDLLFYEDRVMHTEKLTLPHPFLQDRNFVLAPLAEIAPELMHPVLQKTVFELFLISKDKLSVKTLSE
jgi:2-amino-4-hydroxy-6-hydroxymethyldihydropteridine diphosphokinase